MVLAAAEVGSHVLLCMTVQTFEISLWGKKHIRGSGVPTFQY